jgi:hypothetical protein
MSSERQKNKDKERKSDAQKEYERLDNEGRFVGDDLDSNLAESDAKEKIRQAPVSKGRHEDPDNGFNDIEANRSPNKSQTFRVEAQNDRSESPDADLLDSEEETEHARNKANQNRS